MSDKVSVLIPVYNRPELVVRSIRCALVQTRRNLEIVVSDNASTGDTWQIIQRLTVCHPDVVALGCRLAREQFAGQLAEFDEFRDLKFRLTARRWRRRIKEAVGLGKRTVQFHAELG